MMVRYILQMLPECFCISVGHNPCLHHSKYRMSHFSFVVFISTSTTKGWTPNQESSPLTLFSLSVSIADDGVSHRPTYRCFPTSLCIQ